MMDQLISGLQLHGLLDVVRSNPQDWKPIFTPGEYFSIELNEFLDNIKVSYSELGSNDYDKELNIYKAFSDCVQAMAHDRKYSCSKICSTWAD